MRHVARSTRFALLPWLLSSGALVFGCDPSAWLEADRQDADVAQRASAEAPAQVADDPAAVARSQATCAAGEAPGPERAPHT